MKCYALTQNLLPLYLKQNRSTMDNRIFKVLYAVFMAVVAVTVVVFMIIHLKSGQAGQYSKLMTAGYVLIPIWALSRRYTLIKHLRR